jgi:hypothetical protein
MELVNIVKAVPRYVENTWYAGTNKITTFFICWLGRYLQGQLTDF